MKDEEFVALVRDMRAVQRAYFKTRSRAALDRSMALEREVDLAVAGKLAAGDLFAEPAPATDEARRLVLVEDARLRGMTLTDLTKEGVAMFAEAAALRRLLEDVSGQPPEAS